MTLAELLEKRDVLKAARFEGVSTVRFGNDEVTYKSDAQMVAALAAIEAEIASLSRGARPRTFYPQTRKGL